MSLGEASAWAGGTMACVMLALWWRQQRTANAGVVDVAWAYGTAGVACVFAWASEGWWARRLIVAGVALGWGVRLGTHLWRRVGGEPEDVRYAAMRESLGERVQPALLAFFLLQASWTVLFALPMWAAASVGVRGLLWTDALGVVVALLAVAGEGLADRQLARFRKRPRARYEVCDEGLWRYSRHPNYFFEWVHWWAYVAIASSGALWWLALLGPAVVYLFLTQWTGIPYLEKRSLERRGESYRRYQRTTNAFFPWPPKSTGA